MYGFKSLTIKVDSMEIITNSLDFVNRVNNVVLNKDEILVSFDICLLFPKVPIPKTIEYLVQFLK